MIRSADRSERPLQEGVFLTELDNSAEDPSVSIDLLRLAPGAQTTFLGADVRLIVLEGQAAVSIEAGEETAEPEDVIIAPARAAVEIRASGDRALRLACIFTPRMRWDAPERADRAHPNANRFAAGIWRCRPEREYATREGCFINAIANVESDPAVSVARARVEPGMTTALHVLPVLDERYLIARGSGTMQVDAEHWPVRPGDVVLIPKGAAQRITAQREELVFWCMCTPRFTKDDYQHLEDPGRGRS